MATCKEILKAIDDSVIKSKITSPCKMLESTYHPKYLFPRELPELQYDCANYYNHLNSGYLHQPGNEIKFEYALAYAVQYIDQALSGNGGMRYVCEECQHMSFSYAKNVITSGYIGEMMDKYIHSILQTYVNPNKYEQVKMLMKEYVEMFDIELNGEGEFQFLIAHYETVLRSHVKHYAGLAIDRKMGRMVR